MQALARTNGAFLAKQSIATVPAPTSKEPVSISRHRAEGELRPGDEPISILVIDDNRDFVDILTFSLRRAGYEVLTAYEPSAVIKHVRQRHPSLVLLDINLGECDGFDLLKELRRLTKAPVIILSARQDEEDKITGLDLGADDYICKPIAYGELLARVRVQLRRQGDQPLERRPNYVLQVGSLTLNSAEHQVLKNGQRLPLTVTEYRLLHYLMINAGTVLGWTTIGRHVWGHDDTGTSEIVRVTMYRLRKKVEADPANPELLITVPGVGFLLTAGVDSR